MYFSLTNTIPNGGTVNLLDELLLKIFNYVLVELRFDRSDY
jgi:hypothetical protein